MEFIPFYLGSPVYMCFSHISYSTYSPAIGEDVLAFSVCCLSQNIGIHSYRLVVAIAAVKNRDVILGM